MKRLAVLPLILLVSCAYLTSNTSTNPQTGEITTRVRAITLFDSQSALTKFQNRGVMTSSNEWAPGTSIGSLNQEATSTNLNQILGIVVQKAVEGAVGAAK